MNRAAPVFVLASFMAACCARVTRLPDAGESVQAAGFAMEAGGKGFNVAVGLHRLGLGIDGLIVVGNDPLGSFAADAIARAGLPATMLHRVDSPTGGGIGFIGADGENRIAVYPGANAAMSATMVDTAAERVAVAAAVVAQFEIGDGPIERAFAIARAAGVPTFLNPSPYRCPSSLALAHCDVLVVNRVEASRLAADHDPIGSAAAADAVLAERLFARGLRALLITEGAGGAVLFRPGEAERFQPAFAVRAVDTVGAGDAFLAGLVAVLAQGGGWDEAMRDAAACGALVSRTEGVLAGLPTATRVAAFCADRNRLADMTPH